MTQHITVKRFRRAGSSYRWMVRGLRSTTYYRTHTAARRAADDLRHWLAHGLYR